MKNQFLSNKCIINCLKTVYNIEVVMLTPLLLGADMNASVYKADANDGLVYFIKLKYGHHHDIGVAIVGLLQNVGVQMIAPIKTIHGQPIQQIEDFTLIVYPFVEGQDGFSRQLRDEQWCTLGKMLKQVHEIEMPLSIQNKIRHEAYSSKWREIVRSLCMHIEVKPLQNEIALKLWNFIQSNKLIIRRLVDRAEQLAQEIQCQTAKFVLCHSDIHGGNVLIEGNGTIYIVDWDDPIMAPKERDLMFIGGGVANIWNKPHEEKLFYQGYGNTVINKTILTYYRHERIVEDIAEYAQALLLTTDGGENRIVMYRHFMDMFNPQGVVDIAFKTDESLTKHD